MIGIPIRALRADACRSALLIFSLLVPCGSHASAAGPPVELTSEQLFAKVSPAVAKIHVYGPDSKIKSQGSGFFVSPEGLLVTNYHVMVGAASAKVVLGDGKTIAVSGIAASIPAKDLILLKVDASKISFLWMSQGLPKVGAKVFAVGSPKGLTNTISEGLVSGHRKLSEDLSLLQTTAAISSGSSGGPLLTTSGEVVGVTTAAWRSGQNLNFAIPSSYLKDLLKAAATPTPLSSTTLPEVKLTGTEGRSTFPSFEALLLDVPETILPKALSDDKTRIKAIEWTALRCEALHVWSRDRIVGNRISLRIADPKFKMIALRSRPRVSRMFFRIGTGANIIPERYQVEAELDAESASHIATVCSGKTVLMEGRIDSLKIAWNSGKVNWAVILELSDVVVAPYVPVEATKVSGAEKSKQTTSASTPEEEASRKLALAHTYLSNGLKKKAREMLTTIVTQWPQTGAAIKAKKILEELRSEKQ